MAIVAGIAFYVEMRSQPLKLEVDDFFDISHLSREVIIRKYISKNSAFSSKREYKGIFNYVKSSIINI
ncbi:hypothetical protein IQ247_28085 [Plectonema cf. radiosum LEGE 06105]|uniref:Uncharacterized protein n=1 Tax=Plectonema cf. radiosum LEGE 06105 TaxID=945769 RepID=A0A8J7JX99_9CYAN|nr:hypothetical protein [Plectonema radiosum]MBE9216475.1 hypothetical protein [Plectonema cf. radiosum LEGE 06105]